MLVLQSKNILLIHKIMIYKIIKGTRKIDLFCFIDYGYMPATVQNSVGQSR